MFLLNKAIISCCDSQMNCNSLGGFVLLKFVLLNLLLENMFASKAELPQILQRKLTYFVNLMYLQTISPNILIGLIFPDCRCWALALFGGNGETGFEQNSTYSVFSISITLTDEGYEHFYEVNN